MNASPLFSESFLPLERRDLIRFEHRLRASLAPFIPYAACSLHFPGDAADRKPTYIADEERLLLPLHMPGLTGADMAETPLLGLFVARGVPQTAYDAVSECLPQIAASAMENLLLYKAALCDPVTGLFSRRHFVSRVGEEVLGVGDSLRPQSVSSAKEAFDPDIDAPSIAAHPFLAVLVIRLHGLRQIVRKHGHTGADDVLFLLGGALRDVCPEQGAAARISDYEIAVLIPAATPKACKRLAGTLLEELGKVGAPHELTRTRTGLAPSVGYALYPQDVTGNVFLKPAQEQAHILLRKARLAAALAAERLLAGEEEPVLAFGRILAEGGRVAETMPLSRISVSVGSSVNAREGQRFSVHASGGGKTGSSGLEPGAYKGEIVLIDVRENTSIAEIIHQADPSQAMAPGDSLVLLPGGMWGASRTASGGKDGKNGTPDPVTGLLRHGDFLAAWSEGRESCDVFSLSLLRLAQPVGEEGVVLQPEQLMAETMRLFRDVFGPEAVGGRYGLTSLMAFHPGLSPEEAQGKYETLCRLLGERFYPGYEGAAVAAGVAGYPYLDCRKADVLENCRKALEYGVLLPHPHVGVFDSLAMTISADKRFSHGDALGAMTEYKRALLADESNALAWNSLGVTLARLGRHDEARGHFDKAIALQPDAMAFYNMGYSCQCLGERQEARRFYTQCQEKDPEHMYALVRLGQLAETEGDNALAREFYDKAGDVPGGRAVTRRYLAGLALRENKTEEAREHLHEALSLDPQNAVALQMLAEIYLDGGEDVEVAESLARQSVILRPGLKAGWLALSRALDRAGRSRQSREALMRAGEL